MASYLPFNSVNGDRVCKAEDWAWYFSTFIGTGVFPNPSTGLQVVGNNGMIVNVAAGYAFINGYAFNNESDYALTLDTADGSVGRIDRVVLRWDLANRLMCLDVLKGTASASPVAVAVTRSTEIYELALADITVVKGTLSITQADITDQRYDSDVCGIVTGTVEQIDFDVITAQFDAFIEMYQDEMITEFTTWFNEMKDQLSEDAAGNLQEQIDDIVELSVDAIDALFMGDEVSEDV